MFSLFKRHNCQLSTVNCQFRIEGIAPAPLTPEPDEAEVAAAALLQSMTAVKGSGSKVKDSDKPKKGTPAYFRAISNRIAATHASERRAALRYIAYCEQELAKNERMKELKNEKDSSLFTLHSSLESGLYKHMNTVDREGGDLKRRWQHCLAEVTVRLMKSEE